MLTNLPLLTNAALQQDHNSARAFWVNLHKPFSSTPQKKKGF